MSEAELREIHDGLSFRPLPSQGGLSRRGAQADATKISWRAIFHRRDLAALMVGYFSFGYVAWIFFSWFFLYMAQTRGVDLKSSARYAMLPFVSMTVCCLAGGALSDHLTAKYGLRVGRCGLATVALLLTAIFLVVGSQVHSPLLAGIILAGGAGALYLSQSSFWSVSVGYCRTQLRHLFQHGEHGRTNRRSRDGLFDTLDCPVLWMDNIVRCRGGSLHRWSHLLDDRTPRAVT